MDLSWQWPGTLGQSQCPTCTNVGAILRPPQEPERSQQDRRIRRASWALSVGPVAVTMAGEPVTARQNVSNISQFFGLKRWAWRIVTLAFILLWMLWTILWKRFARKLLDAVYIFDYICIFIHSIFVRLLRLFPMNALICPVLCSMPDHYARLTSEEASQLMYCGFDQAKQQWRKIEAATSREIMRNNEKYIQEIVRLTSLGWNRQESLVNQSYMIVVEFIGDTWHSSHGSFPQTRFCIQDWQPWHWWMGCPRGALFDCFDLHWSCWCWICLAFEYFSLFNVQDFPKPKGIEETANYAEAKALSEKLKALNGQALTTTEDLLDNLLKKNHPHDDPGCPLSKSLKLLGMSKTFFHLVNSCQFLPCVSQAKEKTVVVIGGGLSGLACGKYLSDAGHKAVGNSDVTFLILLHHELWRFWTGIVKLWQVLTRFHWQALTGSQWFTIWWLCHLISQRICQGGSGSQRCARWQGWRRLTWRQAVWCACKDGGPSNAIALFAYRCYRCANAHVT